MKAVVIGSGALGLGFIAERLAADYDLCLVDTTARAKTLNSIAVNGGFLVNICALDGVAAREVIGFIDVALFDDPKCIEQVRDADLVLTCTGRNILDGLVARIAPAMNSSGKRQWLLFCENGLDIASAYASHFGEHVTLVDTVMSRMCRFAGDDESCYEPMWAGAAERLVVEEYDLLPVESDLCDDGPFSAAFSMVSRDEFLCWEDIKLYLHNGMHAFVSYHAHLEGAEFFHETSERIRQSARRVALEEVVPAIAKTHKSNQDEIEHYVISLLDRFVNPYFNDRIDRGIRGVEEKLLPGERLLGGCEYIRRAGIEPKGYSSTIEAGKEILRRSMEAVR